MTKVQVLAVTLRQQLTWSGSVIFLFVGIAGPE